MSCPQTCFRGELTVSHDPSAVAREPFPANTARGPPRQRPLADSLLFKDLESVGSVGQTVGRSTTSPQRRSRIGTMQSFRLVSLAGLGPGGQGSMMRLAWAGFVVNPEDDAAGYVITTAAPQAADGLASTRVAGGLEITTTWQTSRDSAVFPRAFSSTVPIVHCAVPQETAP